MPTTPILTFSNQKLEPAARPDLAVQIGVKLKASTAFAKGMLLGEITASPGVFAPYASGNSDGSQVVKAILPYDCQTDAASNITYSATAGAAGGEFGQTYPNVDVYIAGYFRAEDLPQSGAGAIDANAVAGGSQLELKQGLLSGGLVCLT